MKRIFTLDNLTSGFFYLSILLFLIGFNFTDAPPPFGWYQQFMPNLGGKQIQDIVFIDSLTGYASANSATDSSYILKTTNGGDNWQIIYRQLYYMTRLQFLNSTTGYAGGAYVHKTTNGGINWTIISSGLGVSAVDISVWNEDTIWFVESESLSGGVFFTSNGGQNWTQQFYMAGNNPNKIYMFNRNIGFISTSGSVAQLFRTSDSGLNWTLMPDSGFTDIYFIDGLTGWKSYHLIKKTTDGGMTWQIQQLPTGGLISNFGYMQRFSNVNKDTIWGAGGFLFYGGGRERAIIYRTINGGVNWEFQLPDTIFAIPRLTFVDFVDRLKGWAYSNYFSQPIGAIISGGVHTVTGGDTVTYSSIKKISNSYPVNFILYQNYPNPFNPITKINYKISKTSNVSLEVFDINGRRVKTLVKQKQGPGEYTVEFDGSSVSSGVYFYRLQITNEKGGIEYVETKKAILVK